VAAGSFEANADGDSSVRGGDGGRTTYSGTPHRGHGPGDPAEADHSQRKHTATGPAATDRAYARA
jgi:hypothetical protein